MGNDTLITAIGVIIGLVFGMSAVSTLVDMLQSSLSILQSLGAPSTMWLLASLVVAIIFIMYVRVLAGLIAGVVIGVVLNMLSVAFYGQDAISVLTSML
ncbi:MAG: hypothetical protein ACXQT1_00580 [Methermicoccaceae archaeon]